MILYICALDDYGFQGYATQENCTKSSNLYAIDVTYY